MFDSAHLITHTATLQRQGFRQLLIVSGDPAWCLEQTVRWRALLPGDWMWLGDMPQGQVHCTFRAARTLLGREFLHAVFDAREGFNADALAILAGTLQAGSWLLLLVPEWQQWPSQADADSRRWSEVSIPISTPNFVRRWQQLLLQDRQAALLLQHHPLRLPVPEVAPQWQPDAVSQQQALLETLLTSRPGIFVLIAPRGRGKSALAGSLAARWPGRSLITAPAKISTGVLAKFAGDNAEFIAPDRLLAISAAQRPKNIDWLMIDEAAAIPAPLLHQLVRLAPRVLLTTTSQGYEGTGRGFLLKFCASLAEATVLTLEQPLRWSADDPLERFLDRALLFGEAETASQKAGIRYCFPCQADWLHRPALPESMYQLLASAHYRTSPLDLRRMMDAPGMHFSAALQGETVQGALWLVDEGGLEETLAQAVWAGLRRPAGNLVAQSLAAHSGFPEAAQMRSRRICRIAIAPLLRRGGIGREMVRQSVNRAMGVDFLSVSFGYTASLWRFWQACGFSLVRFGSKAEASSGCYTAMAILPLSVQGHALVNRASQRLARDWPWLQPTSVDVSLDLPAPREPDSDEDEWRELAGFAWGQRPFEASVAALGRLVGQPLDLPLLQGALLQNLSVSELCQQFALPGRKALLARWRQETQRALQTMDATRSAYWQDFIRALNG
ncbi:tRNA(Met) cytidine acetyltransferase [Erwinia psidii]|uniref:tRNA(Met) cytidine acetyltransferase TmcA n=1 Tax=Erwinia psidii TaxID=69224 RepID=UPI00226B0DE3|nr:GNAT family N-acetyltransferase [Erwinia psidii]MCX8964367.1 tRNA(Met) cytidine acetyltransferase [Erwinia psidii]